MTTMTTLPLKARVHFAVRELAVDAFGRRLTRGLRLGAHVPNLALIRRILGIQLTAAEINVVASAIARVNGGRLLVFGLGNDSLLWRELNREGTTTFLEDDRFWMEHASRRDPGLHVEQVTYTTRLGEWAELIGDDERLVMDLPAGVAVGSWDTVLVDAPPGYRPHHPGRMQAIRQAASLVADGGSVFVHDCHREVERRYARHYFGDPDVVVDLLWGFIGVGRSRSGAWPVTDPETRAAADADAG